MRRFFSFSLVELLVVIAVISILAALLLPALQKARDQAKLIHCVSNEKQMATGLLSYADDYNKWGPPVGDSYKRLFVLPTEMMIGYLTQPHATTVGRPVLPGPYVCPDFPKTLHPAGTIWGKLNFSGWDNTRKQLTTSDYGILTSYGFIFGTTYDEGTAGYFWYGWSFTPKSNFTARSESGNYFRPFPRLIMLGTAQRFEHLADPPAYTHDYQFPPASRQPIGGDLKSDNFLENKMPYYSDSAGYRSPHKSLLSTNTMFADGHVKSSAWKGKWDSNIDGILSNINFNR